MGGLPAPRNCGKSQRESRKFLQERMEQRKDRRKNQINLGGDCRSYVRIKHIVFYSPYVVIELIVCNLIFYLQIIDLKGSLFLQDACC